MTRPRIRSSSSMKQVTLCFPRDRTQSGLLSSRADCPGGPVPLALNCPWCVGAGNGGRCGPDSGGSQDGRSLSELMSLPVRRMLRTTQPASPPAPWMLRVLGRPMSIESSRRASRTGRVAGLVDHRSHPSRARRGRAAVFTSREAGGPPITALLVERQGGARRNHAVRTGEWTSCCPSSPIIRGRFSPACGRVWR